MFPFPTILTASEPAARQPLTNMEMVYKPLADWIGVEPITLIAAVVIVAYLYMAWGCIDLWRRRPAKGGRS